MWGVEEVARRSVFLCWLFGLTAAMDRCEGSYWTCSSRLSSCADDGWVGRYVQTAIEARACVRPYLAKAHHTHHFLVLLSGRFRPSPLVVCRPAIRVESSTLRVQPITRPLHCATVPAPAPGTLLHPAMRATTRTRTTRRVSRGGN